MLVLFLAALFWLLLRQDIWLAERQRLTPARLGILALVLSFIGWWGQGQLSTVTPLSVLRVALQGGSLQFLLFDPFSLLIWLAALLGLLLWGRGFFCGWLCPFGALQEFIDTLARRLKLPQFEPSPRWNARLSVQALWRALAAGRDGAAERASIGWDKVSRQDGIALPPGMALTFNGIAQGFVTDFIAEMLMARGFDHQLVDIGELRAGAGDWRIGLFDPQLGHFSTLTASRSAFATSSPRAMVLPGGEGHILGPHGEKPQWSSVIVEAESAGSCPHPWCR